VDPAGGPALLQVEHTWESLQELGGIYGCLSKLNPMENRQEVRATFLDSVTEMA
jgi:hypothetical protein